MGGSSTERTPRGGPPRHPAQQRPLEIEAASELPAVTLKAPTWYPIIYRKRVESVEGNPRPGDCVAVYDAERRLLGYGLYNARSEILVRMVRHGQDLPDLAFWRQKLTRAVALRRELLRLDDVADAYRVLHAEADGFSGLVVDRYGDILSAEAFSLGMYQRAEALLAELAPLCGTQHYLIRPSPQFVSQEGITPPEVRSPEMPASVVVQERGTRFRIHFEESHKTGFFCDQRDNRLLLADFCRGRTVLDLCCYTGGFAVTAKRLGQAAEVTGVDLDEAPLKLARENANLNQVRANFVQADAFAYMRDMLRGGRQYDVVVLDPPKLIRSRNELLEGKRKHFDLNRLAMQLVRPGGLLLTCSCAGLLGEDEFLRMLYAAARQAGPEAADGDEQRSAAPARQMQVLMKRGAAPDHPVAASFPEAEYLKAIWVCLT